jgi:hypothetical protein
MRPEPEDASAENLEREEKIERAPEGNFGSTRERLSEVEGMNLNRTIQKIREGARTEAHLKSASARAVGWLAIEPQMRASPEARRGLVLRPN